MADGAGRSWRVAICSSRLHGHSCNGRKMVELRKSIIAAVVAIWSISAYGQSGSGPAAPSSGDVADAVKTMKDASAFIKAKRKEAGACEDKIRRADEFRPIARRIPPPGAKPAGAQLADRSPATADEARAMTAVAPKFKTCRAI